MRRSRPSGRPSREQPEAPTAGLRLVCTDNLLSLARLWPHESSARIRPRHWCRGSHRPRRRRFDPRLVWHSATTADLAINPNDQGLVLGRASNPTQAARTRPGARLPAASRLASRGPSASHGLPARRSYSPTKVPSFEMMKSLLAHGLMFFQTVTITRRSPPGSLRRPESKMAWISMPCSIPVVGPMTIL